MGRLDGAVLFDPELAGFLLREVLPVPSGDFQDLPEWRDLWVRTASTLIDHGTDTVVMPMTVDVRWPLYRCSWVGRPGRSESIERLTPACDR